MKVGGDNLRVNENVGVYRLHGSATIHQVKKRVAVEQIHAWLLDGFPTAKCKWFVGSLLRRESLPEQVVGHSL